MVFQNTSFVMSFIEKFKVLFEYQWKIYDIQKLN
jgi:hypothetical protein